jgi:hypothetical protein
MDPEEPNHGLDRVRFELRAGRLGDHAQPRTFDSLADAKLYFE